MIKVLLFGVLATKAGCREIELAAGMKTPLVVSDILEELKRDFNMLPAGQYLLAVNQEQAYPSTEVKDGDEVALMPPFSGG